MDDQTLQHNFLQTKRYIHIQSAIAFYYTERHVDPEQLLGPVVSTRQENGNPILVIYLKYMWTQ